MNIRLTVSQKEEFEDLISFLSFAMMMKSLDLVESARVQIGSFCHDLELRGSIAPNQTDVLFEYMIEEAKKRNR
jgi:hypothetical protein